MKRTINLIFLASMMLLLNACIELKDKNESEKQIPTVKPGPQNTVGGHGTSSPPKDVWEIDEPLYLFQGRWIKENEYRLIKDRDIEVTKIDLKYNNIKLTHRGALYTLGNDVTFEIQNLESYDGFISTFPENAKALAGKAGKNGGHIVFKVASGDGKLNFILRGENGADGVKGAAPDDSLKGENGIPPDSCSTGIGVVDLKSKAPTSGKKGFTGNDGYRGGNSGTLNIEKGQSLLQFKVDSFFGKGGERGPGGEGGMPGIYVAQDCRLVSKKLYNPARPGERGNPGQPGKNGVIQDYCIIDSEGAHCVTPPPN